VPVQTVVSASSPTSFLRKIAWGGHPAGAQNIAFALRTSRGTHPRRQAHFCLCAGNRISSCLSPCRNTTHRCDSPRESETASFSAPTTRVYRSVRLFHEPMHLWYLTTKPTRASESSAASPDERTSFPAGPRMLREIVRPVPALRQRKRGRHLRRRQRSAVPDPERTSAPTTPQGGLRIEQRSKSNKALAFTFNKNRNPLQHGIPLHS